MAKYVYFFGGGNAEGRADMKELLGGKGANLAEMSVIGIPVPPGFTITTEVCAAYYENGRKLPEAAVPQVEAAIKQMETQFGARLGDPASPLLVSVRSGAALSMPGMMNTILNLGLNDASVKGLAKKTGNDRFAYDGYRRLTQPTSEVSAVRSSGFARTWRASSRERDGACCGTAAYTGAALYRCRAASAAAVIGMDAATITA